MADDRHERHRPVPGVLGLPRHLLGALSPRDRRIAVAVCAAAVVGLLALVVVLAPRISDTKQRTRAQERVAARELAAEQRRRRVREQSCTAVTSDIPQVDGSGAGFFGYPYRALGHPDDGHFAFCKVAGRAGEAASIPATPSASARPAAVDRAVTPG